jgi:hypothetical protein
LIRDPDGTKRENRSPENLQAFHETILARTIDFLAFAGNPQNNFNSVHVAGTSGKGSVVTMISALLSASGAYTGHHVSPFLQIPNEKLIASGKMIKPSAFSTLIHQFREFMRRIKKPTKGLTAFRILANLLCILDSLRRGLDSANLPVVCPTKYRLAGDGNRDGWTLQPQQCAAFLTCCDHEYRLRSRWFPWTHPGENRVAQGRDHQSWQACNHGRHPARLAPHLRKGSRTKRRKIVRFWSRLRLFGGSPTP